MVPIPNFPLPHIPAHVNFRFSIYNMGLIGPALSLLVVLYVQQVCTEEQWETPCPQFCTCHRSQFSELPLNRWINKQATLNDTMPAHFNNDVLPDDFKTQVDKTPDKIMKMVMCVFLQGSDPDKLLSLLPADVQVLTILQGRDTGELILEADHVLHLQQLEVLEIQGFAYSAEHPEGKQGKLIVRSNTLRALPQLQYLNLQHVKLMGIPTNGNLAPPAAIPLNPISNDISIDLDLHQQQVVLQRKASRKHRLVFLPPADGEGEILPYKVYVEQQERAAMSTFTGLSNLKFLRVSGCHLQEISWEMFDGLYNLHYLSLENNELRFVPDFAFLGTPNLKSLSLANNQLLNLQSAGLAGLFELESLDLSHNNFSHLSELSLPPFPKLLRADFRNNPIETVFASTFEIMNATATLYIGGNESTINLQPNSFVGLINLHDLTINNVNVPMLERELLRGMPKLKDLRITGKIETISFDAFLEVPKLENLALHHCNIKTISMDAFYGLYGLLYLDLSDNLLEFLPPGLFDQQFSLRELHLRNNRITRLPPGFLVNIPAKMVRLDGNPWHCSCAMKDWQPAVINKVKQRGKSSMCQFYYDKGSMCKKIAIADRYVYDKRVAPRCSSPSKYNNWSIFQVLRKELRCSKKVHIKMDRKAYLKKKYEDYEKTLKPLYIAGRFKYGFSRNVTSNSTSFPSSVYTNTTMPSTMINSSEPVRNTTELPDIKNTSDTASLRELLNKSENVAVLPTMPSKEKNNNTQFTTHSISVNVTHDIQDKGNATFNKEKDKLKLLQLSPKLTTKKETVQSEGSVNNVMATETPIVSKKAWKIEMEKRRQEKLKKYQT